MSAIVSGALMGITGGMGKGKKAMGAGDPRGADFTKPANFKLTDLFTGRRNQFGGSTTSSDGVITYNITNTTNIGTIEKEADEVEIQQKIENHINEFGYMSG